MALSLNRNTFADSLDSYSGINVHSESNGHHGWVAWSGDKNDYNQVVEYTYSDKPSGESLDYRSWYPEVTVMPGNVSLTVSLKIDYERSTGDDHLILQCNLDSSGQLLTAQASVQFHGAEDKNLTIEPLAPANVPGGDLPLAMYNALHNAQENVDYGGKTDNAGRKSFAYIAQLHLYAFSKSVQA